MFIVCLFVLFCFCFLFSPLFSLFFLLIAWSRFPLIFHIARFQFQKYKIFSFWHERAHPPQTPPVCASMQLALMPTKSSPNVEDGCTALCSFGVLAVVKCCKQYLISMIFFLFLYINSRLFYLGLWRMKINLFTKFWGKLLTTTCPNKNLTIFARKIYGYKWKFWNKFGLHYNKKGSKLCLLFVSLKSII